MPAILNNTGGSRAIINYTDRVILAKMIDPVRNSKSAEFGGGGIDRTQTLADKNRTLSTTNFTDKLPQDRTDKIMCESIFGAHAAKDAPP